MASSRHIHAYKLWLTVPSYEQSTTRRMFHVARANLTLQHWNDFTQNRHYCTQITSAISPELPTPRRRRFHAIARILHVLKDISLTFSTNVLKPALNTHQIYGRVAHTSTSHGSNSLRGRTEVTRVFIKCSTPLCIMGGEVLSKIAFIKMLQKPTIYSS